MSATRRLANSVGSILPPAISSVRNSFYGHLFGWTSHEQRANGGVFMRLRLKEKDVGSLYQMQAAQRMRGMPSHWTPYVRVGDVDETVRRAESLGGQVIVRPFLVDGVARIALVLDAVGAQIGLWEPLAGE